MEDKKLSKLNQDELLNKLEKWFTDATSWDKTWRDNAETWYDYYHGNHWTSEEISALEDRGQNTFLVRLGNEKSKIKLEI